MTFNPEKHLMDLGGKSYLEVKWRLVWFRQDCPGGTIDTEEMEVDTARAVEAEVPTGNWIPNPARPGKKMPEKVIKQAHGYARYRAIVTDGKGGRATATKSENAASFPDFIEKAETGAVGRALAMLGYGTQFTGDELSEEHRIVDSPVERVTRPAASQPVAQNDGYVDAAPPAQATHGIPTPSQLRLRCDAVCGRGFWGPMLQKVFKVEVLPADDDLTPDDCLKIVGYLDKAEAMKSGRRKEPAKAS